MDIGISPILFAVGLIAVMTFAVVVLWRTAAKPSAERYERDRRVEAQRPPARAKAYRASSEPTTRRPRGRSVFGTAIDQLRDA